MKKNALVNFFLTLLIWSSCYIERFILVPNVIRNEDILLYKKY